MTDDPQLKIDSIKAMLDKAQAAIFDNDGTLVDTMPLHFTLWQKTFSHHSLDFPEEKFYALAGMPAPEVIHQIVEEQSKNSISNITVDEVMKTRRRITSKNGLLSAVKPINVSAQLLEYAKLKNIKIAVASGSPLPHVLESLKGAGFDIQDFDAVVTSDDVKQGKPHPETFLLAAQKLGVDPSQCVGFEDGDKGLEALDAAGIPAVDVRLIQGYPLPECLRK